MCRLHLDFETFSLADIKKVGAYRYAFDPSTEILCMGMALDDQKPVVWTPEDDTWSSKFVPYIDAIEDPEVLIYAHNAMMEYAIFQAAMPRTLPSIPCPAVERFRCTMSLGRRACLPGKLEKLAEALGSTQQKDNRGKALIRKFSMMQPKGKPTKKFREGRQPYRIYPRDEPEAFAEFMEYCAQDVRAEQEIAHRLAYFDEPINNANYTLDAKINARGVPVNLDALRHAQSLIEQETEIVNQQFREITGLDFTQTAEILKWAQSNGYAEDNLQAETVEKFLESNNCSLCQNKGFTGTDQDIECEGFISCPKCGGTSGPGIVEEALSLRASVSYAAVKKVKTMLACAGPHDNRIRGMLAHHGATTGRWTNHLVQFQNMKRPTIDNSEEAYADICNGISLEMLRFCYGPPLEVISSCIRHFVQNV